MVFRRSILALGALAAFVGFAAWSATAADSTDALVKYFRKKNNLPPTQNITVKDVKDSPIKGAKQGVLDIAGQQVAFIASPDMRYVVFGDVDDITVDPSKAVMDKISLKGEPFKGPKDAKVTIVEYSDFQCPFCSKGYNTMEKEVLPQYTDKVKFYYKHLPLNFHPWAEPAAIAYECIKQQDPEAAWVVYRGFFENQKDVNPTNVKEKAMGFITDKKIDKAKFDDCYDNKKTLPKINADRAEAAALGITGTPSFVVNGRHVKGAQPADRFKAVIDDELASSK
ncbi:MAG TPA: thioredoxin domain-containing protein [Candidatus Binatia bacterium]|nr:thioredoxin domain-containing protein [Candidatus Binatia bacterium]